jgi:1-acyl-sn-glycerol-3-phosphate acyltransferase
MRTPKPPRDFWFARMVRATLGRLLLLVFRVRMVGGENLPSSGGYVLAGNHISYADPMLLWCAAPRPTHCMAKSELWGNSVMGWGLDMFWAFPVDRGHADRTALGKAKAYLEAGEPVAIFPEGTRNFAGEAEAQGGAAFVALRSDVPLVPVGITGTAGIKPKGARFMRFPRVTISVGPAIRGDDFPGIPRKEVVEAMTAEVMRRIAVQVANAGEVASR